MAKFAPGMTIRIILSSFSFLTVPVFLASLLIQLSQCYPEGAPDSACSQLMPTHSGSPQTSSAPYLVRVSATTYVISGNLTVTLDTSTGRGFEGFLLQARLNGTATTVGQFSTPSGSQKACQGTSVTHRNKNLKTSMAFNWSAPSTSTGDVVFVATFVKDYSTCWVSVSSTVVKAAAAATTTTSTTTTTTSTTTTTTPTTSTTKPTTTTSASTTTTLSRLTTQSLKSSSMHSETSSNVNSFGTPPSSPTSSKSGVSTVLSTSSNMMTASYDSTPSSTSNVDVDISTCEKTKRCFLGDNCDSTTCDLVFTWADAGNNVAFELSGKVADQSSWLSVGLSYDDEMGDDSVTDCIVDNTGKVNIQMSWNSGKSNSPLTNVNLSLAGGTMSGGYANGRIFCRFSRPKFPTSPNTNTEDQVYYPGSDLFYLFVGTGPMSNGYKSMHLEEPIISPSKQNLTDFSATTPTTTPAMTLKSSSMHSATSSNMNSFGTPPSSSPTSSKSGVSTVLSTSSNMMTASHYSTPSSTSNVDVDISTCEKTKRCFLGDNCDSTTCDFVFTWADAGNNVAFELSGRVADQSSWLSVGLSYDDEMGDDSVTDCIVDNTGKVNIQMSWNSGKSNSPLTNGNLSLADGTMSGGYANGRIFCRFSRPKFPTSPNTNTEDQVYYPGSDLFYLFVGTGPMSNGYKSMHLEEPIISPSKQNLTDFSATRPTTTPAVVVYSTGCGTTKGCLKGKNCMNGVCDYILTWSNAGNDTIAFELSGVVHGQSSWLSFGMSLDDKMGSDSVTDCIYNPASGKVDVQMSWNPGHSNSPLSNKGLGLISGSMSGGYANGRIVCRFSRVKSPSNSISRRKRRSSDQVYYPGTQSYYVFVANGLMSNGAKQTHSDQPIVSDSVIDLTSIGSYGEGSSMEAKLIKAHGIIMLFAWLVFASFGMLMSRHFKTVWPGKKCCGKALWFQLHQPCMIITLLLSAAAFIIIFCEVLGYSEQISPANAHPPLGIIVMALVIINPVMSIFRCDPGAEHRWIFDMCHFGVGMLAQILSVVVIYLATYINTAVSDEHLWCRWVLIAYICWHVLLEAAIVKQKTLMKDAAASDLKNYQYSNQNYSLDDLATGETSTDDLSTNPMPEPRRGHDLSSCATTFLVVMHLCVVVGCTVAMAVAVGLS